MMKNTLYALLSLICLSGAACTPTVNMRGNMVDEYKLSQVTKGVDTRTDVLRKIGSPTTVSPFDDSVWYYLGQTTEKTGVFDDEVKDERIVVVMFTPEGVVEQVQNIKGNRQNIPYVKRETPTSGNEMTVMQQMLGNLGKFNKEGGPTGGVGAPGH
ncbi:MAG: outer membrane protein assembly factor BamE [Micavibrio aeruginosavorus]|uniref:Outer membrane protein assembly factor BamE n=1 Tax=Micavibrio aeruginosavorus TaxID=349221 RepID=A0A7T5R0J5_9BACT|nr:MAG: outer membrane protein assembly factor BamE [Micavibrio aeruginosavorus]